MVKRFLIIAIMVLTLMVLTVPATYAIPTLKITDQTTNVTVTITDEVAGDGNIGQQGVVSYNGPVGSWRLTVTTGLTKPDIGNAVFAEMDLNSIVVESLSAGGTLKIQFSENNFGPIPESGVFAEIGGTIANTIGNSLTYMTYLDPGNVLFTNTIGLTNQGPFSPIVFSGTASAGTGMALANYSLTQDVTIVHKGPGRSSFNANLKVPEPSTLLLLGVGLVGMGFLRRKVKR